MCVLFWLECVPSRTLWKMWCFRIRFYLCYLSTSCFGGKTLLCVADTETSILLSYRNVELPHFRTHFFFVMSIVSAMEMKYWCVPSYSNTKCCTNWSSQITAVVSSCISLFNDVCHYLRLERIGGMLLNK